MTAVALGGLAIGVVLVWRRAWGWRGMLAVRRRFPARIERYKHAGKPRIRAALLADPEVAAAVAVHAAETGDNVEAAWAKVRAYVDEIVPSFNLLAYYRLGYGVSRLLLPLLYKVSVGHEPRAALNAIPRDSVVIYLMNHRSNADYVARGLRPVGPGGRLLRGRRVGARVAAGDAVQELRLLLRAPALPGGALPQGPRALRPAHHAPRGHPGRLHRGRPHPRRRLPASQARPARLPGAREARPGVHAAGLLRAGGHQLRPRARGPLAAARGTGPRRAAAPPRPARRGRFLRGEGLRPIPAAPGPPLRARLRELRRAGQPGRLARAPPGRAGAAARGAAGPPLRPGRGGDGPHRRRDAGDGGGHGLHGAAPGPMRVDLARGLGVAASTPSAAGSARRRPTSSEATARARRSSTAPSSCSPCGTSSRRSPAPSAWTARRSR